MSLSLISPLHATFIWFSPCFCQHLPIPCSEIHSNNENFDTFSSLTTSVCFPWPSQPGAKLLRSQGGPQTFWDLYILWDYSFMIVSTVRKLNMLRTVRKLYGLSSDSLLIKKKIYGWDIGYLFFFIYFFFFVLLSHYAFLPFFSSLTYFPSSLPKW